MRLLNLYCPTVKSSKKLQLSSNHEFPERSPELGPEAQGQLVLDISKLWGKRITSSRLFVAPVEELFVCVAVQEVSYHSCEKFINSFQNKPCRYTNRLNSVILLITCQRIWRDGKSRYRTVRKGPKQ